MDWSDLKIGVLLTGSELLDGRLQDTNSLFISRFFFDRGKSLERVLVCGDDETEIIDSLRFLASRCNVVITSGGLGPTTGDKTREAISQFAESPLVLDADSLVRLKAFFTSRNRPFEANNERQAYVPDGGIIIPNEYGTATCFAVRNPVLPGFIVALPGVPRELQQLLPEKVFPLLRENLALRNDDFAQLKTKTLRTFGLGESNVSERVREADVAKEYEVAFRASFPEVQVFLRAHHSRLDDAAHASALKRIEERIGKVHIFSEDAEIGLPETVHQLFIGSGATLSVAESCTGGLLGSLITSLSGSSSYFAGGVISYANSVKTAVLGVQNETLENHGAVSAATVKEMAAGVQRLTKATYSLAITGIAGPDGGSPEKPVGTCFVGLAGPEGVSAYALSFPSTRDRIRRYTAFASLDLLRRILLGLPVGSPLQQIH